MCSMTRCLCNTHAALMLQTFHAAFMLQTFTSNISKFWLLALGQQAFKTCICLINQFFLFHSHRLFIAWLQELFLYKETRGPSIVVLYSVLQLDWFHIAPEIYMVIWCQKCLMLKHKIQFVSRILVLLQKKNVSG